MKKPLSLLLCLTALGAASLPASVNINIDGGVLTDSNGSAIGDGGLILLVASTTDSIFNTPLNLDTISVGSSWGDDQIIGAFSVSSLNSGFAGGFSAALTGINYSGNLSAGDALQLYWFPTLSLSSSDLGIGTSYGAYRTDATVDSSSSGWVMPSDSTNLTLNFFTTSVGGSIDDVLGQANLTTVPEPAATVAMLGGVAGAFVFWRRRQGRRSTPAAEAAA